MSGPEAQDCAPRLHAITLDSSKRGFAFVGALGRINHANAGFEDRTALTFVCPFHEIVDRIDDTAAELSIKWTGAIAAMLLHRSEGEASEAAASLVSRNRGGKSCFLDISFSPFQSRIPSDTRKVAARQSVRGKGQCCL